MTEVIGFDGTTASGKTTLCSLLKDELEALDLKVAYVKEINNLRGTIKSYGEGTNMFLSKIDPIASSLIWVANAYDKMGAIPDMVDSGDFDYIFLDRTILTPIVYETLILASKGLNPELKNSIDYVKKPFGLDLHEIKHYFVLYCTPEESNKRLFIREQIKMTEDEIWITEKAIENFLKLGDYFNIDYIDTTDKNPEAVLSEVLSILGADKKWKKK